MNMLVSASALVLAGASFVAYDLTSFRGIIVDSLLVRSRIIGASSVSALTFNDVRSAETTLSALEADPHVVYAGVYGIDRRLFAAYRRAGAAARVPESVAGESLQLSWFDEPGIVIVKSIVFQGSTAGTVLLRSDLDAVHTRLRRYGLIVCVVLAGSLVMAFVISRIAQRSIASPLTQLVDVTSRISRERDYSVRATEAADGLEFEQLREAFNEMLTLIERRDAELEASRLQLEARVEERTAELTAVNQELEAFSYSVSHDLRAPLRHISGFVSLLDRHAGRSLDGQGRRYLETIASASTRMGQLIDDLLTFSRMSRAMLVKKRVNLETLVRDVQNEIAAQASGRDITWTIHPLPDVECDASMLRIVLVNLLSNAVKYSSTRPQARIEIGVSSQDRDETVLFVRDNGVGFDMQYAHKLFGVFQRLHRLEDFEGTGIGLASVRRIIQRHGGRTWAESVLDRGATFYVSLPRERVWPARQSRAS
jgi:signal transduction histidine kinase